jgi:ADP-ribosyl-[dinitrogen reductase] hydrolase
MSSDLKSKLSRAQGCLLGQLAGDSLGSLVEFKSVSWIQEKYPDGVRDLADGGTWDTLAGQPTDDSEMALKLARMLVENGKYDSTLAMEAYVSWFKSHPFDYGSTTSDALTGHPNSQRQSNGALMRVSPLGIFGANFDLDEVAKWASLDASLTHPHPICRSASALFAMAIAFAISNGITPQSLYEKVRGWAKEMKVDATLQKTIVNASENAPADYKENEGWVLLAFQNALFQLLHAPDFEQGVIDTVRRGGDTDTNGCICGALLGAVWGREAVPERWVEKILNCQPKSGDPRVKRPRPECFWPTDALELAGKLVGI